MIKRIIKAMLKPIDWLPKKYIIFESIPDYTDNAWAVYQFMKSNPLFSNYKLIWAVNHTHKDSTIKSVAFNSKLYWYYYARRSCAIVFCNRLTGKSSNNQLSFFLCHGSKSKKTRGKYEAPKDLDYILVQADVFKDALAYEYNLSGQTQMVTLGYPRNDDLLIDNGIDIKSIIGGDYQKLIVWYPTFRQHKSGNCTVSHVSLPIIHDEESADKLNACARENGVYIVLKPHFAQDTDYIKNKNYSHIKLIDDDFLVKNKIRSYQLLALSDAILTDYSSVYYDYLLTDAPIGLVWEDYDEYKKNQGFAMDPDLIYSGGEKIFNVDDFCAFIRRVSEGEDILKEERRKIRDLTNVYQDATSSERVAMFILEKLTDFEKRRGNRRIQE